MIHPLILATRRDVFFAEEDHALAQVLADWCKSSGWQAEVKPASSCGRFRGSRVAAEYEGPVVQVEIPAGRTAREVAMRLQDVAYEYEQRMSALCQGGLA